MKYKLIYMNIYKVITGYVNMPGPIFNSTLYISDEEANKFKRGNKIIYGIGAVSLGMGILAYATESIVRNMGGIEFQGISQHIFNIGSYLSFAGLTLLGAPIFSGVFIIEPKKNSENENLEEKTNSDLRGII